MLIRVFAFALLVGASIATAAPPKSKPPKDAPPADTPQPAETIDVDAMARAKDADPNAPAPEATPPAQDASPAPPAEEPATSEAPAAENAPAPAASAPEETAPTSAAQAPAAPPVEPTSAEKSLAASCVARATALLDNAEKGDFGDATRDFDAKMRTALPAPKLKQAWDSLAQFGKLNARGQSHLGKGEGYTVVMIPLIFEKTNLVAQVACGSDGRVAGFYVKPIEKPEF